MCGNTASCTSSRLSSALPGDRQWKHSQLHLIQTQLSSTRGQAVETQPAAPHPDSAQLYQGTGSGNTASCTSSRLSSALPGDRQWKHSQLHLIQTQLSSTRGQAVETQPAAPHPDSAQLYQGTGSGNTASCTSSRLSSALPGDRQWKHSQLHLIQTQLSSTRGQAVETQPAAPHPDSAQLYQGTGSGNTASCTSSRLSSALPGDRQWKHSQLHLIQTQLSSTRGQAVETQPAAPHPDSAQLYQGTGSGNTASCTSSRLSSALPGDRQWKHSQLHLIQTQLSSTRGQAVETQPAAPHPDSAQLYQGTGSGNTASCTSSRLSSALPGDRQWKHSQLHLIQTQLSSTRGQAVETQPAAPHPDSAQLYQGTGSGNTASCTSSRLSSALPGDRQWKHSQLHLIQTQLSSTRGQAVETQPAAPHPDSAQLYQGTGSGNTASCTSSRLSSALPGDRQWKHSQLHLIQTQLSSTRGQAVETQPAAPHPDSAQLYQGTGSGNTASCTSSRLSSALPGDRQWKHSQLHLIQTQLSSTRGQAVETQPAAPHPDSAQLYQGTGSGNTASCTSSRLSSALPGDRQWKHSQLHLIQT
ncbi:UNVERIFIED_CONTAM: hypothetical protein FKN15_010421 [Acipenser sinensis]